MNELTDRGDLELIVRSALKDSALSDARIAGKIVEFYLRARECARSSLVDGANKAPHYSLRTLCRTLDFVCGAESMKLSDRWIRYSSCVQPRLLWTLVSVS